MIERNESMSDVRAAGDPVADFALAGIDGNTYSSAVARQRGLLLFALYKQGCGTCKFTAPFLQRFHDEYACDGFRIWAVSQDSAEETREFADRYGLTFPLLLDESLNVTVAYRLKSVPAIYLVDESSTILRHAPAFMSNELNAMAQVIAERKGVPYAPIVRPEDDAPALKPG